MILMWFLFFVDIYLQWVHDYILSFVYHKEREKSMKVNDLTTWQHIPLYSFLYLVSCFIKKGLEDIKTYCIPKR